MSGPGAATALDAIADGRAAVVVGTHALFSERVRYARLGLVVVDEQHRFGVEQRGALEAKTTGGAAHVLLMTATPIPRTLGQVLYADLDVSDLRTVPAGRVPIRTTIRRPDDLDRLWEFVRGEAAGGPAHLRRRPPHRRGVRRRGGERGGRRGRGGAPAGGSSPRCGSASSTAG